MIAYTALSLFNYTIDSACMYSQAQVLERITDSVLSGKIIAGQPFFQFRLFQKLIIKKKKIPPHTIALGSSRTMELRSSYLGLDEESFFNHSLPSAILNDFIAILGCYKKRGVFPHTVIIGIDPDIFDAVIGTDRRWVPIASEYYHLLPYIKEDTSKITWWYELAKAKGSKHHVIFEVSSFI